MPEDGGYWLHVQQQRKTRAQPTSANGVQSDESGQADVRVSVASSSRGDMVERQARPLSDRPLAHPPQPSAVGNIRGLRKEAKLYLSVLRRGCDYPVEYKVSLVERMVNAQLDGTATEYSDDSSEEVVSEADCGPNLMCREHIEECEVCQRRSPSVGDHPCGLTMCTHCVESQLPD